MLRSQQGKMVKYCSRLAAKPAKDLASFPLHTHCNISKVVQKTQHREPGMRNVTHRCLLWVRFPSPSRQEIFSGSHRGKQKPELKADSFSSLCLYLYLYLSLSLPPPSPPITWKERKIHEDRVIIQLLTAFRWLQIKKKDCQQMYSSTLPLLRRACYSFITSTPTSML